MLTSPLIPVVGLALIVANIVLAAVRPYWAPTAMGIQLFIGGMTTILIAVIDLINPVGIVEFERVLLFVSGCLNCTLGYYMTLLEMRRG
ncbi:MAG: hypothetical protein HDKAJFGB_02824 [Anaerolineae bacterium]|nr:hypothetical protein [Anaerolineae bacterium]MDL1897269.1 hypothetical protein [Anaerolineae bacterium CFX7]RIK28630.1 MAG: hypothetical protein DCC52_08125 [Chloroflexota bacterium]